MANSVSASLVLYKTPSHIVERAINCILESGVEMLWIIDHSPVNTLQVQIPKDSRVLYRHMLNKGYGAGNNIALRESLEKGFKYHIVMNPDVYWKENVVEILTHYMNHNQETALVMPKVLFPDGTFQLQAKFLPTARDMIMNRLGFRKKQYAYITGILKDAKEPVVMPFLSGCFMFLRIDALKNIGLFDERFFMYCEDMDLSRRINEKFKTVYYPGTSIYHDYGRASRHNPLLFIRHSISALKYFYKWRKHKRLNKNET